jgi:hypothetical protein
MEFQINKIRMSPFVTTIKHPVKRHQAEQTLFIFLICFALSVTLTRLFLELTGYPQLGNSELHIAHVLWGGLLLFVSVLVLIIFANPWVYPLGALLGGAGVGLFIDEVGKFITQSNDYFYPFAAPIIYAFFLLTVLLYLRINQFQKRTTRSELYKAFELLAEVLDRDLDSAEQSDLLEHLQYAWKNADTPDLERLAKTLLDFSSDGTPHLTPLQDGFWIRVGKQLKILEERWFSRNRLRWFLILGLLILGVFSFYDLYLLLISPESITYLDRVGINLLQAGLIRGPQGLVWFTLRTALLGAIGGLLVVSALLLILRWERAALTIGYFGILLELTGANLLEFYFDQFSTILLAIIQLILLIGVLRYKKLHLT